MPDIERWSPIPGAEPYEASTWGNVRNSTTGHTLSASSSAGYPSVMLSLEGGAGRAYVHRLVLMAFAGMPRDGQIGLHGDGDKTNNRLENLRWGTYSENALDSVRHGTHAVAAKTHCKWGHLLEPWNLHHAGPSPRPRVCLACRLARDYSRSTSTPLTQSLRDRFYCPPTRAA